jgi:drug/metabolite transporter (DMT)-like permease
MPERPHQRGGISSHEHRNTKVLLGKAAMVALWTSGFIAAALATKEAAALAITFWRLAAAAVLMTGLALVMRASWPREPRVILRVAATGILLQAVQFAGIYLALEREVPASVTALLIGSSPVFVAALARVLFNERLRRRGWIGSAIGVTGVVLAIAGELRLGGSPLGFLFALVGLAGLVSATLIHHTVEDSVDLISANAIQLTLAAAVMLPVAALTQGLAVTAAALPWIAWLTCGISIGAALLFFWLLQQENSGTATNFLYLVPSTTAVAGILILGQPLQITTMIGLAAALLGVRMMATPNANDH